MSFPAQSLTSECESEQDEGTQIGADKKGKSMGVALTSNSAIMKERMKENRLINLNDSYSIEKPIKTALDSTHSETRSKFQTQMLFNFSNPSDIETRLRDLLADKEAVLFDLLFIMTIVRRKHNKHYLSIVGNFKIFRHDERRIPAPLPKALLQKQTEQISREPINLEIARPAYDILEQCVPKEYRVNWDLDSTDPVTWSDRPPQTTAKAWVLYDVNKNLMINGKNQDQSLEIASMTKIMTFFTCLKILYEDMQCLNINPRNTFMRASSKAAKLGGTSAYIKEGLRYSIYDLLVGLMLPSGNDASIVLAENFGRFLSIDRCRNSL